ncbi:MAG TPA: hypothetical protein PKH65_10310 [Bacteroidia bacterium]|nr:hypothetical protein [Bacteroidia bacterium]
MNGLFLKPEDEQFSNRFFKHSNNFRKMFLKFSFAYLFLFMLSSHVCIAFDKAAGWTEAGRKSGSYKMGIDKEAGFDGSNCGTIQSIAPKIEGFGLYIQKFKAENYRGKKISFTGFMKSVDVSEQASFMIRVDKNDTTAIMDNMHDREIKGSTDWKQYEITMDVPDNAVYISIGASIKGTGQIWFDNLSFQLINNSEPLESSENTGPINLNFEKIVE